MRPRQPVFAADYFEETVAGFLATERAGEGQVPGPRDAGGSSSGRPVRTRWSPRPREQGAKADVIYEQCLALCRQRR